MDVFRDVFNGLVDDNDGSGNLVLSSRREVRFVDLDMLAACEHQFFKVLFSSLPKSDIIAFTSL